ncbi:MAG: LemA family protein [Nanoarchaeota archaeon]|nr:LemA family protein [Nanoarchaeota archaeon]
MIGFLFILGVIIVFVAIGVIGFIISIYNGLIMLKNNIKKSWANIDVLLKQRTDEIPKLVACVKGYMKHEKKTLEELTKARTSLMHATSKEKMAKADNMISGTLKTLFAVAENYPNLKANETFLQLQNRISGIENELADRREFYNDSVNTYNIKIQSFPDMFIARKLDYKEELMFKVSEQEKQDVKIEF